MTKGLRTDRLEQKLTQALEKGEDVVAQHIEKRIVQKERKQERTKFITGRR